MRRAAFIAACACSLVGVALSIAAAIERTAPGPQRLVFGALSIMVTLAAHGLLVVVPTVAGRVMWCACMALVAYGHITVLSTMSAQAGSVRAQALPPTAERIAIEGQLAALTARPTAAAAAAQAAAEGTKARADRAAGACERNTPGRCAGQKATATAAAATATAAATELRTAQRADELRERLAAIAAQDDQRRSAAAADPAASAIQHLTGLDAAATQSAAMALYAISVELLAVLLWSAAFPRQHAHHATRTLAPPPLHDAHPNPHHWAPRRGGSAPHPLTADQAGAPAERPADHPHRPEPQPGTRLHRPDQRGRPRRRPRSSQHTGQSAESG